MRRLIALALLALAPACSRSPEAPPPEASAPAPVPAAEAIPAELPPEKLPEELTQFQRGRLLVRDGQLQLALCEGGDGIVLEDRTGGMVQTAFDELAPNPGDALLVELRSERVESAVVIRELLRAMPVGAGNPCEGALPAGAIRAYGNEPFWNLVIGPDGALWTEPDPAQPLALTASQPVARGTLRAWSAQTAGPPPHRVDLVVTREPCRDGMSGAWHALTAQVTMDGRELRGCAHEGG